MIFFKPFFFLGLLLEVDFLLAVVDEDDELLESWAFSGFWISFTCAGGGRAWPPLSGDEDAEDDAAGDESTFSSLESGDALGFSSFESVAPAAAGGWVAELSGCTLSDRGAGSLGGGPVPTLASAEMEPPPAPVFPNIALVARLTTSFALVTCGSTRVGSPTCVACATSGCFLNPASTLPNIPVE